MEGSMARTVFDGTDFPHLPVQAVGIIRNAVAEPILKTDDQGISMDARMEEMHRHIRETKTAVSEIVIREELMELLDGIDDYSHLIVLYWGHKVPDHGRLLTRVHPMGRKELPRVGIFGTRSPARPNPVLMTTVRLTARSGNILHVTGLDAIDNSPVIDIKPYVPERQPRDGVRMPQWMERIQAEIVAGDGNDA
ncbi:tRNA-Thr(GGU) m(6)t(6)A37 methyltransferase TsaA [Desulfomicrobium macestii]|uniref:tRNA-Thr(GGU) m(6)t(6)A37 methyltransferase TsaA n=1 Tax=Desulfomicrobium macestii TaxID=90731 RepID=A0ABR9H6V2_9BACT|nr:tRNA (N6-threonylcarbamoyladenosine(37)-N6)-methyltransferase TrmO [Desulfomicrobium macestii]MBE1426242.1 tRNA-Thr(GGU) m(6)t(6)A37 methyltransferase TsaA [Desulfomicrobium macestii]